MRGAEGLRGSGAVRLGGGFHLIRLRLRRIHLPLEGKALLRVKPGSSTRSREPVHVREFPSHAVAAQKNRASVGAEVRAIFVCGA